MIRVMGFADGLSIQKAIDAALGTANPATSVRRATDEVVIPAGEWLISQPLRIYSAFGLRLRGEGGATRLIASGALPTVLDINGAAHCSFSDFSIEGNGTESVQNAVNLYWDRTTAARSTTRNRFERVDIIGCKYVNGFMIGSPGSLLQCDQTDVVACSASGSWKAGESTWWQAGMQFGGGGWGNNCAHHAQGVDLFHNRYNLNVQASQVDVSGITLTGAEIDIVGVATNYLRVAGGRSEQSQRLYRSGGPGNAGALHTIEDIDWSGDGIAADGDFVQFGYGGCLRLNQIRVTGIKAGVTPHIRTSPTQHSVLIDGMLVRGFKLADVLKIANTGKVHVRGFGQLDAKTGVVVDQEEYSTPTAQEVKKSFWKRLWSR